jgi:cephalosporin hydroxylase
LIDEEFEKRNRKFVSAMAEDKKLKDLGRSWFVESFRHEYSYHFRWMGVPIIQYPQDIIALQEVIWRVQPDAIVETGIARGGSLIFSASMLELLGGDREVVGVDIDIRHHNRIAIEAHPMAKRISMIEGSSVDKDVVDAVRRKVEGRKRILVILDSNHTHDHVLRELRLYSSMVTLGSYLIVFDTVVEQMPDEFWGDRPWGKGDNPMTAVHQFLKETDRFEIDTEIHDKLQITVAPDGYLRCVRH